MLYLVYVAVGMFMLAGALYLSWLGQRQAQDEALARRLAEAGMQTLTYDGKDWLTLQLERAGIQLRKEHRSQILLALGLLHVLAAIQFGLPFALLMALALVGLAYSVVAGIYKRRQVLIVSQLPRLLDQVVRLLRTGKTLGDAFGIATRDADDPLKEVMLKLQRNITLGMTIPEAFNDLADTYALKELQVLALGVQVNARFGGSLVELLNNIITLIRQREQLSRQLRALTGETRTSAVVLSALPLLLGTFMVVSNPDYIDQMVRNPTGQWILSIAAGMQVLGMVIIWRMLRSV